MIPVLYDGWALTHQPNSPAALHLLTLLAYLPNEVQAAVVIPGETPVTIPDTVQLHLAPQPDSPAGRLRWEQQTLPQLARALKCRVIHLGSSSPPLFSTTARLISPGPAEQETILSEDQKPGLIERLRLALGAGGLSQVAGFLWPADIPAPVGQSPKVLTIPPAVHPAFSKRSNKKSRYLELPGGISLDDSFVLYHGPAGRETLQQLLDAWSWAAAPIGEQSPLVILGANDSAPVILEKLFKEMPGEGTIKILPSLDIETVAEVYHRCTAVLHPGRVPVWGSSIRYGLAAGKPVAASESVEAAAIAGSAAYLTPEEDSRGLAAALITIVVEESVADQLSQAAQERATGWDPQAFQQGLSRVYRLLDPLHHPPGEED